MFTKIEAQQKVSEMYPKLLKELNDSHSPIPAYYRFKNQDPSNCLLRSDLKEIKARHFKQNYNKELFKPKETMADVQFKNESVSGAGSARPTNPTNSSFQGVCEEARPGTASVPSAPQEKAAPTSSFRRNQISCQRRLILGMIVAGVHL